MIYKETTSLSSQKLFTRNIFNASKFTRHTHMHNFLDKNNKVVFTEMDTRNWLIEQLKANSDNSKECWIGNIFSRAYFMMGKERKSIAVGRLRKRV